MGRRNGFLSSSDVFMNVPIPSVSPNEDSVFYRIWKLKHWIMDLMGKMIHNQKFRKRLRLINHWPWLFRLEWNDWLRMEMRVSFPPRWLNLRPSESGSDQGEGKCLTSDNGSSSFSEWTWNWGMMNGVLVFPKILTHLIYYWSRLQLSTPANNPTKPLSPSIPGSVSNKGPNEYDHGWLRVTSPTPMNQNLLVILKI